MSKKNSHKFVKQKIEEQGYELLSKKYKNALSKLKIRCNKGHEYEVSWNSFQQGRRCLICSGKKKYDYVYVKQYIEKQNYILLSKKYINAHSKLLIKCPEGHIFEMSWNNFRRGQRCPKERYKRSSNSIKHSHKFVKQKIEEQGYEFLSKKYINANAKLKVKCPNGHEYKVRYGDFQQGHRCPICSGKQSKSEKEIAEYIKSFGLDIIENDRKLIFPLELDIIIPEKKIAIEYCGIYWNSEKFLDKNYHKNKLELTNKAGYRLITIFEDEWINKKDIVKNRLKYFLGLNNERIYARKCEIREIDRETAKAFVDKYHIQGHVNSTIYLGAFYNEKTNFGFTIPKLVAVNTFVKHGLEYELNRFCVNSSIIGIASKFIKHFQRNYEWKKITTFADLRWSEGDLYEKIGFVKDKILRPDYSYFLNNSDILRYHKFGFRHISMKNKLENYEPELSEHKNMLNHNYYRIYDCGKIRYVMENII